MARSGWRSSGYEARNTYLVPFCFWLCHPQRIFPVTLASFWGTPGQIHYQGSRLVSLSWRSFVDALQLAVNFLTWTMPGSVGPETGRANPVWDFGLKTLQRLSHLRLFQGNILSKTLSILLASPACVIHKNNLSSRRTWRGKAMFLHQIRRWWWTRTSTFTLTKRSCLLWSADRPLN